MLLCPELVTTNEMILMSEIIILSVPGGSLLSLYEIPLFLSGYHSVIEFGIVNLFNGFEHLSQL